MDKAAFKEYADLKVQEKKIKARLEELNPILKEQISNTGADKVETDFGNFTLGSRTTWEYSDAVTKLQEKEKATGVAKEIKSMSLIYKAPKEKTDE